MEERRQEAANRWERRTQLGAAKYRAKIAEMHANYVKGLERFWGVTPHARVIQAYQAGVTPEAADRLAANTRGKAALWLTRTRAGVGTPKENDNQGAGALLPTNGNGQPGDLEAATIRG